MNTALQTPAANALNLTVDVIEVRPSAAGSFLQEEADSVDVIVACCCCCCGVDSGVQTEAGA